MATVKECGCPINYDLLFINGKRLGRLMEPLAMQTDIVGHKLKVSWIDQKMVYVFAVVTGEPDKTALMPCELELTEDGMLTVGKDFVWDFATMAADTPDAVRASVKHDIMCELVNRGALPKRCRKIADKEYYRDVRAYGMGALRARIQYIGVRIGAWL